MDFLSFAAGDVTDDGRNLYLYGGAGRICAVKNLNTGQLTGYIYDAEGNRVAKGTLPSAPDTRSLESVGRLSQPVRQPDAP